MEDMGGVDFLELFRLEVEAQAGLLNENLLALEQQTAGAMELEAMMRAAHSIKGAARIVQMDLAVRLAHVMEDCFVAAQAGTIVLRSASQVDVLLRGVDTLVQLSKLAGTDYSDWQANHQVEFEALVAEITAILSGQPCETAAHQGQTLRTIADTAPLESASASRSPVPNAPTPPAESQLPPTSQPSSPDSQPFPVDSAMLELFLQEGQRQVAALQAGLASVRQTGVSAPALEPLRATVQALKAAALLVQLTDVVRLARLLEEYLMAVQEGKASLADPHFAALNHSFELLRDITQLPASDLIDWLNQHRSGLEGVVLELTGLTLPAPAASGANGNGTANGNGNGNGNGSANGNAAPASPTNYGTGNPAATSAPAISAKPTPEKSATALVVVDGASPAPESPPANRPPASTPEPASTRSKTQPTKANDRVVRVSADNLNRLMGLAGESLVEANWLQPFADSLLKLKHRQAELYRMLDGLYECLDEQIMGDRYTNRVKFARQKASECRQILSDRLNELELFARRSANLSDRLYREVIASHMRPFADGVHGFPRMVRDLSRRLGKQVRFEILGKSTQVDRDILEKLETPLTHILQNSIDHGIETPEERTAAGKPAEGTLRLEAVHRAGMLSITVTDDGRGINFERLRQKIITKGMVTEDMADQLSEAELLEFLFLPGFSTAKAITDVSGRGVGLDVVHSMVQEVGGTVRAMSQPGQGMSFHLQLPLTLSVIRTLLVEVAGEPYAFPLTRIDRIGVIPTTEVKISENREYFQLDEQNIGLVAAQQILELSASYKGSKQVPHSDGLSVVIISDASASGCLARYRVNRYALVVDCFLGERDLVVRPLDPRLGKIQDISAVALMEDGSPVLIVDVEDMIRTIDKRLTNGQLGKVSTLNGNSKHHKKRILVVDDSITVREVERKLLSNYGYDVEVAVNGMDGWNAVRTGKFDLVITDIDMPRMNGIELVTHIKSHPHLKAIPVIIVSYKDREEDRLRGLQANADRYLTKSSFHDDTLIEAVMDLVGAPAEAKV